MTQGTNKERFAWDCAVAALFVLTLLVTQLRGEVFPGSRWVLVLGALGIVATYAFSARRYVLIASQTSPSWGQSLLTQVALVAALTAAVSVEPNALVWQVIVFPLVWLTSRSTLQAMIVCALMPVPLTLAYAASLGFGSRAWMNGFVITVISAIFAITLGLWISRIADWGEERARLLDELTAAQAQLEAASRQAGATEERTRMARDIHDTIAQSLTSIVMLAERAKTAPRQETIAVIEDAAREALREARTLVVVESANTHPQAPLAQSLARLAARFERETQVRVRVEASETQLPRDIQVVLLRCAQEGLANVRKHAEAGKASLTLEVGSDAVLTVSDDGVGLGRDEPDASTGFGVAGMRERVSLAGGTLTVGGAAGGGTTLVARIPLGESRLPVTAE